MQVVRPDTEEGEEKHGEDKCRLYHRNYLAYSLMSAVEERNAYESEVRYDAGNNGYW